LFAGGTVWPVAAAAQQRPIPLIGYLSSRSAGDSAGVLAAFLQGLREVGFVEGLNIQTAFRWADGHYDRLPALAADLVGLPVAAIFAAGGPASALAAKAKTSKIPIVFSAVTGPVELGLVASLNRPGGNVTGMSMFAENLWAKSAELLKQFVPNASVIAFLINPSSPSAEMYSKAAAEAASTLGVDVRVFGASTEQTLEEAFASLAKSKVGGVVVPNEPFLDSQRNRIVALAQHYVMPAIYSIREYVVAGGLLSYGPSLADSYRRAGIYLARVLKGEKPADLPVQQPTKFELFINLKTAKALGLAVPPSLLAFADEVIE
jgi:putative tryptophan/tyrosine transport system substrate-binding protein